MHYRARANRILWRVKQNEKQLTSLGTEDRPYCLFYSYRVSTGSRFSVYCYQRECLTKARKSRWRTSTTSPTSYTWSWVIRGRWNFLTSSTTISAQNTMKKQKRMKKRIAYCWESRGDDKPLSVYQRWDTKRPPVALALRQRLMPVYLVLLGGGGIQVGFK